MKRKAITLSLVLLLSVPAAAQTLPTGWEADPVPPGAESASAEYNLATGELKMSINGAVNAYVNSASGLITPLPSTPDGVSGLLTNNRFRVGMTNLSPINVTNFNFGSIGAGIPCLDLSLVYTPRLGAAEVTVQAGVDAGGQFPCPETCSFSLAMTGLCGMAACRRRRYLA